MAQTVFTGKERVGRITVERFRDSIRLRWTYNSKTYSLTIGKDSKETVKAARAKAQTIDSDITWERFDLSLAKYSQKKATVLEVVSPIQEITLGELWNEYVKDKLPNMKRKTIEKHDNFTKLFKKLGTKLTFDGLAVKQTLLDITTVDRTRDSLMYLSACCDWGIEHNKLQNNPFKGMYNKMPKPKYLTDPTPNAFTREERDKTIEAFYNDERPGMNYKPYGSFVEFLFLTACRPSEAVGLTWGKVNNNCTQVTFDCSIQNLSSGEWVQEEGSKNNKKRTIGVSDRVQKLLQTIKPDSVEDNQLVFHSPGNKNQPIHYRNFVRRAWSKVVDPIKPDTTPYNCRDTFITLQILDGMSTITIAKYCDTSAQVIERSYADKLKLVQLRPKD